LLKTDEATLEQLIRPALRYLADTGLGANRTAGKGQFRIEVTPAPALPDAGESANGVVMLSRYLPRPTEWSPAQRPLAYKLVNLAAKREQKFVRAVPGQVTTPIYKRRLRMFEPGCVVPYQKIDGDVYGQLVEVVPDEGDGYRTWQSGLAIGLRARVEAPYD
jgi:CRISPR type III-A-associated RAMP protein Csm4